MVVPYRSISGQVTYIGDDEDACIVMYVYLFVSGFCSDVAQVEGIAKNINGRLVIEQTPVDVDIAT